MNLIFNKYRFYYHKVLNLLTIILIQKNNLRAQQLISKYEKYEMKKDYLPFIPIKRKHHTCSNNMTMLKISKL